MGGRPTPAQVLDALPGLIAVIGPSGELLSTNRDWNRYAEKSLAGRRIELGESYLAALEASANDDAQIVARSLRSVLAGSTRALVHEYRAADGMWWRVNLLPLGDAVICLQYDITDTRRSQEALRSSEARERAVVDNTPNVAIQVFDSRGVVSRWNRGAERVYGFSAEEAIGRPLGGLIHDREGEARLLEALGAIERTGEPDGPATWAVTTKTGQQRYVYSTVFALPREGRATLDFVCMDVDITERVEAEEATRRLVSERKMLEAQLLQSQKMEGIGRLAGGIAHDFNNLLTAIVGCAEIVADQLPPGSTIRDNVEQILKAGHRAAELTRQLLTFARRQASQPRVVDLNQLIAGTEKMLRRLIGEDIALETAAAASLSPVRIDPGQLEQVLVNLAVNARDAMPTGGCLRLETADVELKEPLATAHGIVGVGAHVRLTIADTGTGMTEEVLGHLFEPFFTTKELGKGTGLGLATCYGIVKQAGGQILVRSAPLEGAVFEIYLPRAASGVDNSGSFPTVSPVQGGGETVLLVEDEPIVRDLSLRVLEQAGYRVLTASNGTDALERASAHRGPIELLITDSVMPQMGGGALAQGLLLLRPQVGVLFISGYTDRDVLFPHPPPSGVGFLAKPFTPKALLAKIHEVLEQRRRRG